MLKNEDLTKEAASFKADARKRFTDALTALLALAWDYKDAIGEDFAFEKDQALYNQALDICRKMSDGCSEDISRRLFALVEENLGEVDEDIIWDYVNYEDGETILYRFDMAGSHLIKLLDLWVAAAFANGFSKEYTRIMVLRYLNNPLASGLLGAFGKDALKWGRGYQKNILDQLAVIGQNAIIQGGRYAEWLDEQSKGATYYIRRRGSSYQCDECESAANKPIPMDEPFEQLHSRCCCYPEYHYDSMPEL